MEKLIHPHVSLPKWREGMPWVKPKFTQENRFVISFLQWVWGPLVDCPKDGRENYKIGVYRNQDLLPRSDNYYGQWTTLEIWKLQVPKSPLPS